MEDYIIQNRTSLTFDDRSYMVQKIIELHKLKEYKLESLFTACAIMDRFLYLEEPKNFTGPQMMNLATICVLMSAKME